MHCEWGRGTFFFLCKKGVEKNGEKKREETKKLIILNSCPMGTLSISSMIRSGICGEKPRCEAQC